LRGEKRMVRCLCMHAQATVHASPGWRTRYTPMHTQAATHARTPLYARTTLGTVCPAAHRAPPRTRACGMGCRGAESAAPPTGRLRSTSLLQGSGEPHATRRRAWYAGWRAAAAPAAAPALLHALSLHPAACLVSRARARVPRRPACRALCGAQPGRASQSAARWHSASRQASRASRDTIQPATGHERRPGGRRWEGGTEAGRRGPTEAVVHDERRGWHDLEQHSAVRSVLRRGVSK